MNNTAKVALVALAALALTGGLGAAHARNYAITNAPILTCFDKDWTGLGGAVGGAVNGAIDTADPLAPDNEGTCFRAGHITPNVNGDVTFTASDAVNTNVGICVSQDGDDDGGICLDAGDLEQRTGCNSITVNTADGYDFANELTDVLVDRLPFGSATVQFLIGDFSYCQLGVDDFGTTGTIGH